MPGKYTIEVLEPIVKNSNSWAEVCRMVGVKESTGAQTYVTNVAKKLGISFSHFSSKGWNKGKKFPVKLEELEKLLVKDCKTQSHRLKNRLIKAGLKENKCEICGLAKWNNEDIVLELDHINSDHFDNRIENLQIVCPNCHAQETRNRRKIRIHSPTAGDATLRKLTVTGSNPSVCTTISK